MKQKLLQYWNPDWLVLLLLPVLFAIFFCILLGVGFRVFPLAPVILLAGSVLAFIRTIMLCDRASHQARGDYPRLRTLVCAGLGAFMVLLVQTMFALPINPLWMFPAALLGGVVGWLGVDWARFL